MTSLVLQRGRVIADLKECTGSRNLQKGKIVHEAAIRGGHDSNIYVACTLISMYAKCGSMKEALELFKSIKTPNVVCWNALICGYAANGEDNSVLDLLSQINCAPNAGTFVAAVKSCGDLAAKDEATGKPNRRLKTGKMLHLLASINGCDLDMHVETALVVMYAKCRSMRDSHRVFERMQECDVTCWTFHILGYADNGQGNTALSLFTKMFREGCIPVPRTYIAALKACTVLESNSKHVGEALHLLASSSGCDLDVYVQSTLVDMFGKCGSMENALLVFSSMKHPNVVCWTALISGYVNHGESQIALEMFSRMGLRGCAPDTRILVIALKACADLAVKEEGNVKEVSRERGKKIHLLAVAIGSDEDIYVKVTLVDMYARCGSMNEARFVFNSIKAPNVVSWTALILGYANTGEAHTALSLFSKLGHAVVNARTFVAAFKACIHLVLEDDREISIGRGKALHLVASRNGFDSDVFVESTLVDMYAKAECIEDARRVFEYMKHPDVVAWTVLISGYVETGESEISLNLFSRMKREGCTPDMTVLVTVLKACGNLGALEFGRKVHAEICCRKLEDDLIVRNSLVSFYAKCGSLVEAEQVFDSHPTRNLATWSGLMSGYSRHGDAKAVLDLFDKMLDTGLQPNAVIFLCVLTACSHAGFVNKGINYFESVSTKYGIYLDVEHYNCMIDILGRANKLDKAMVLIRTMSFGPDGVSWMAILGACHKWKNVELGRLAFESVGKLENQVSGTYVLMANIYGGRGLWEEQAKLQVDFVEGQCWWTSEDGVVHMFFEN